MRNLSIIPLILHMKKSLFLAFFLSFLTFCLNANPIKWTFKIEDKGAGEVELVAIATIDAGWYMYDSEVPDGGPNATSISFDEIKGATSIGDLKFTPENHKVGYDQLFEMNVGKFERKATFYQRLKVTDNEGECTPPLPTELLFQAKIYLQHCKWLHLRQKELRQMQIPLRQIRSLQLKPLR